MAVSTVPLGDAGAAKVWSARTEVETLSKVSYSRLIGKNPASAVHWKDDLAKVAGDTITYFLVNQLDETQAPVEGNTSPEGHERAPNYYTDSVVINEMKDAIRIKTGIDQQRLPFSMRSEYVPLLSDLAAAHLDNAFFKHGAGYTPANSDGSYIGNTTIVAPSDIIRPDKTVTADESIGTASTDKFSLTLADRMAEYIQTRSPLMRPPYLEGLGYLYPWFVHPYQWTALRASGGTFENVALAAMQGGQIANNPLITGSGMIYNGFLFIPSTRVPLGVNSGDATASVANVRRSFIVGRQGFAWGTGRPQYGDQERMKWIEKSFGYDDEVGFAFKLMCGFKKTTFNSVDYGVVVCSTYAPSSN